MADPTIVQLGPISGQAGDVGVTLTGMSVRETHKGRRYPYGEFGSEFIEALHRGLVRPRRRGLLRGTHECPRCGASVDGVPMGRVRPNVDVALKRIPSIRVDLEMPGITCPNCGAALVNLADGDLESEISDALIAAFATKEIKPG